MIFLGDRFECPGIKLIESIAVAISRERIDVFDFMVMGDVICYKTIHLEKDYRNQEKSGRIILYAFGPGIQDKKRPGKHFISHRYNRLPLLPSGPGGVRQELVVSICRFKGTYLKAVRKSISSTQPYIIC
jgi:hypothetical protein